MSKIVEALKRTQGEIARRTLEAIDGSGSGIPETTIETSEAKRGQVDTSDSAYPLPLDISEWPTEREEDVGRSDGSSERDRAATWLSESFASGGRIDPETRSVAISPPSVSPLFPFDSKDCERAAEQYRHIRTKIIQHPLKPRLILVSSPSAGDGKSVTAINIAAALALEKESTVLLVDMDLRRPSIASLLGVPAAPGVGEVLAGVCPLEAALVRLEPFEGLYLLPAGKDRNNPTERLSSPRWKALCDEFRSMAAYSILDGPPVDAVAEYRLLEEPADGLILVLRTDHTARPLLHKTLESVPKDKVIGGVINSYQESPWSHSSDYYLNYSREEEEE